MRPGEKLYEELLTSDEGTIASKHEKLFIAQKRAIDTETLQTMLDQLRKLSLQERPDNREIIETIMRAAETGRIIHPEALSAADNDHPNEM